MSRGVGGPARLARLERVLVAANQAVIVGIFFVMFVLVFANVVSRYVLRFSIPWAEEVSSYLLVWMAYLGGGLALRHGRHVAILALQQALPAALARAVRWLLALAMLVFLALLARAGLRYSLLAWQQKTPMLRAPLGLAYLAVPVGALVFAVHLVAVAREYADGRLTSGAEPSPPMQEGGEREGGEG
ncbi:MAG TPA: TRAP transporter small permease [Limnochordales bacterium]